MYKKKKTAPQKHLRLISDKNLKSNTTHCYCIRPHILQTRQKPRKSHNGPFYLDYNIYIYIMYVMEA